MERRNVAVIARARGRRSEGPPPEYTAPTSNTGRWIHHSRGVGGLIIFLVLLVVALGIFITTRSHGIPSVVTTEAGPAFITSEPGGVGNTEPVQSFALSQRLYYTTAPVRVVKLDVQPGQVVKIGTPLIQLDPTAVSVNTAELRIQLNSAETEYNEDLKDAVGASSPQFTIDALRVDGEVELLKEEMTLANGNSATVTSPIAGVVSSVPVLAGQLAGPATILVEVADLSTFRVAAGIQLAQFGSVHVGDAATITFPGLPGVVEKGVVFSTEGKAANSGLDATVLIVGKNRANPPVPFGTRANVTIIGPVRAKVTVPLIGVSNLTFAPAVYVVHGDHVRRVNVTVGAEDENRVQITTGITAGTRIAISNTQTLTNNERVHPTYQPLGS